MAKPVVTLPEWAVTGNYGATVYPSEVIATATTAATSFAAWIVAVTSATGVSAPTDFGEILHPSGGGATPWSSQPNKEATGLAAFANAGIEPAIPIKAESFNEYMNRIWAYADWARLSTSAADLDDHIIQTDATGVTNVAQVNLGGTAFAGSALTVTSNASGAGATFIDTVGNFAATFTANGSLATARFTNTGTGEAIEGILSGSTDYAIRGDAGASGAGAFNADGGTSGHGMQAVGGTGAGNALHATAQSSDAAIYAIGDTVSSSSEAAQLYAGHDDATAAFARTTLTANAASIAFLADARASGLALHALSVNGYAATIEATGTERPALRLVPQSTRGDAWTQSGDMYYDSDFDALVAEIKSQQMGLWGTRGGFTHGHVEQNTKQSTSSGTYVDVPGCSVSLSLPYEPRMNVAGQIYVEIEVMFQYGAAVTAADFEWQLLDFTHGTNTPLGPFTEATKVATSNADERTVCRSTRYLLPAVGAREFRMQFRSSNGTNTVDVNHVSIRILGCFPVGS